VTSTRWASEMGSDHSRAYIARFRQLAAEGADLAGEARLVHALTPPGSRILDAGCGPGRTGAALADWGHDVVGVDADPLLIAAAQADYPGVHWLEADLAHLDLAGAGVTDPFDAAVLAGNVMVFCAPGSEGAILERVAAHVRADGVIVLGFLLSRGYGLEQLDRDARAAGLAIESRFATWDLRPWQPGGDYAVTVLRVPARTP
jgi:SAM-dependent methyltransferase